MSMLQVHFPKITNNQSTLLTWVSRKNYCVDSTAIAAESRIKGFDWIKL